MRRLCLAAAAACLLLLAACAGPESWEREILAMDTVMKLTLYGKNAPQAGEAAVDRIQELEGLLSVTGEDSEIYAANHTGSAQLSPDAAALLARALALCRETGGALDVTIYPVVRAWGFTTGAYRVPDDGELTALREAGFDGLTIGIETGDDEALRFMNKGCTASDIVRQCQRLDQAGIHYSFFYLVGISGAGRGEAGAIATAQVCNQLHPTLIGVNMLTVYPDSELYQEIQCGHWTEEGELEKYKEIRTLLDHLEIPVQFAALGASNAFRFQGTLPQDTEALRDTLDQIIETVQEEDLREYRVHLRHL